MSGYDFRPIILIGAARSGTKLLRDAIATHPQIDKVPYDVNYIWGIGNERSPHDAFEPNSITERSRQAIIHQLTRFHKQAPFLIEKTVSNCLRISYLLSIFPNAQFIHLTRNGYDVIESTSRQWNAPINWKYVLEKAKTFPITQAFGYGRRYLTGLFRKTIGQASSHTVWGVRYPGITNDLANLSLLEVCAKQWLACVKAASHDLSKLPSERVFTTTYESFVTQPLQVLHALSAFLDINADHYEGAADKLNISRSNIGKGKEQLSESQLALVSPYVTMGEQLLKQAPTIIVHKIATCQH